MGFDVGGRVFLKVSFWKGLTGFEIKGKLKSRYIGPFKILQRVEEATYRLTLPLKLSHVLDIFHVMMLRKHELDSSHMTSFDDIELEDDDTYIEKLVRIATQGDRKLRTKLNLMMKVIQRQDGMEE